MYTRFSHPTGTFLYRDSYTGHGARIPGAQFLALIGGAYEYEMEECVGILHREASMLLEAIRDPSSEFYVSAPDVVSELERLVAFLSTLDRSEVVSLYSFDRTPTLDDLLAAERQRDGANDWAMEQVQRRGTSLIPKLCAILEDDARSGDHLSAVRFLLFCFPGNESRRIVQQFSQSDSPTDAKLGAAALLAATAQTERG
jgi:hypothetical protein